MVAIFLAVASVCLILLTIGHLVKGHKHDDDDKK